MSARIIDRGRGPEIESTRVTVFRIMDFRRGGVQPEEIARELALTAEQVKAALDYIAAHEPQVVAEYERILARARQPNPTWVESANAKTAAELRQRIHARHAKLPAHASPRGQ